MTPQERNRAAVLERDRDRKRRKLTALWDAANVKRAERALPPAATLVIGRSGHDRVIPGHSPRLSHCGGRHNRPDHHAGRRGMRHDALTTYINFARLIVERDRRIHREVRMTIEIKGLGANVEAARAAIRRARAATAHMNEAGGALERTANEIAAVFEQHTSDLLREANTLQEFKAALTAPQLDRFGRAGRW